MLALELAMGLLLGLGLFQRDDLRLRQHQALLGGTANLFMLFAPLEGWRHIKVTDRHVIPNRCNREQPFSFSKRLYKMRWRIESAFNRLKDFRRIATRYDRLARNYLASVCLVAALLWWI